MRVIPGVAAVCCTGILTAALCGCESFVKKFRREKPEGQKKRVEAVVAPQEYAVGAFSSRDQYQQHFTVWKAWQEELIDSLQAGGSQKQQLDAIKEGIRNLEAMVALLDNERSSALASKLAAVQGLRKALEQDSYGFKAAENLREAEQLYGSIVRGFAPSRIKDSLR